jgi:3-hydroxyacyl-CoA dehydrogenase
MLRDNDHFIMNRDSLLAEAIDAINNPVNQLAFNRPPLTLPGKPLFDKMVNWLQESHEKGLFMAHDVIVGTEMARIVTGGEVEPGTIWSEQDFFDAERSSFLTLASTAATRKRIETMLDDGAPIRN